jgi:peptidoglycan hydrolase-like protein with peptidoglycan-binding domain
MALTSPRFVNNLRLQAAARNSPPMRIGETNDAVALVQQALFDLQYLMPISFAQGRPDGIYGHETARTVAEFQADESLRQDGVAGHDTLGRLDRLFNGDTGKQRWYESTYAADDRGRHFGLS